MVDSRQGKLRDHFIQSWTIGGLCCQLETFERVSWLLKFDNGNGFETLKGKREGKPRTSKTVHTVHRHCQSLGSTKATLQMILNLQATSESVLCPLSYLHDGAEMRARDELQLKRGLDSGKL